MRHVYQQLRSTPAQSEVKPPIELGGLYEISQIRPQKTHNVVLLLRSLSLKFTDVAIVLEFCLALFSIVATFSAQSAKDVAGFAFAAHFDQPAGIRL